MSGVMSPTSVDSNDLAARKLLLRSQRLSLADNGVAATSLFKTPVQGSDVIKRNIANRPRSSCSMEERSEKPLPPPIVQSPSISAASASNYLKDQIVSFFQVSDNKLAMKLFGNKNALMREKMRQQAVGNWVIHPCSNFSACIDLKVIARSQNPNSPELNSIDYTIWSVVQEQVYRTKVPRYRTPTS